MEYTPFSLLTDVGWISVLLLIGTLARRFIPLLQRLLLPSSITAGLLGIAFGPSGLDWIPFSDSLTTYSTILTAVVFATLPFTEGFGAVARGARTMWSYAVGSYLLQWGLAMLFAFVVLGIFYTLPDGFGLLLPAGWAGGFGTAAAVGTPLEEAGFEGASTLGFTSATAGVMVCIVGGLAISRWGVAKGYANEIKTQDKLPHEIRTGLISVIGERPSIGKASSSPSSVESLALHLALIAATTYVGYLLATWASERFDIAVPIFGVAFLVGVIVRLVIEASAARTYVDSTTIASLSGMSTDFLVAFAIASIVPTVVVEYAAPLALLLLFGLVYCAVVFRYLTPRMFGDAWFERGLFTWGWSTASVATGIALLRMVDPKGKSRTIEEYGLAYVGFAPVEIAMAVLAPILVTEGFGWPFLIVSIVLGVAVLVLPFTLGWVGSSARQQRVG